MFSVGLRRVFRAFALVLHQSGKVDFVPRGRFQVHTGPITSRPGPRKQKAHGLRSGSFYWTVLATCRQGQRGFNSNAAYISQQRSVLGDIKSVNDLCKTI